MDGKYLNDMADALRETGISNVHVADPKIFSTGTTGSDVLASLYLMGRDDFATDFKNGFDTTGKQFNLIGYSYGSLKAAQAALDYAELGGKIDNVVLIGSPLGEIEHHMLDNHPNIGKLYVESIPGDPIHIGMSRAELIGSSYELGMQWYDGEGHFTYNDRAGPAGNVLRRVLANRIRNSGLK